MLSNWNARCYDSSFRLSQWYLFFSASGIATTPFQSFSTHLGTTFPISLTVFLPPSGFTTLYNPSLNNHLEKQFHLVTSPINNWLQNKVKAFLSDIQGSFQFHLSLLLKFTSPSLAQLEISYPLPMLSVLYYSKEYSPPLNINLTYVTHISSSSQTLFLWFFIIITQLVLLFLPSNFSDICCL